jgi:hypothetical protein
LIRNFVFDSEILEKPFPSQKMGNKSSFPQEVNKSNSNGETPIMNAASKNNMEDVKDLIRKGANVNCFNNNKITVLMFAYGKDEIFKYLLGHGISIDNLFIRNSNGDTILDVAEKNEDYQTILYLRIFIESQLDFMSHYSELSRETLKRWNVDETKIIEFYVQSHKKFTAENAYKNLSTLIKSSPTFGHTFTVYTSSRFTIIDDFAVDQLKKGVSIYYPRILKCTYEKSRLDPTFLNSSTQALFLVMTISDKYLFSDNCEVFVSPRFLNVQHSVSSAQYVIVYVN